MILEMLELENVGIYAGVHTFYLKPDPDGQHPVILVKGHNGGGKTTFLDAIRLVLYGKRALGDCIAQSQYEDHLLRKIHATSAERFARVALDFSRVEDGKTQNYKIVRSWASRGASVVESFELSRNGDPIPELPSEDWESCVEDLVPPGVSQMFFFDGEKIQDIADNAASQGIRPAIRNLLGLDLIEQLRTDLTLYAARNEKNGSETNLDVLQTKRSEIDKALRVAEEERAEINSRRDQVLGRVRRAEKAFTNEGGRRATDREGLQIALKDNKQLYERLLLDLKSLAGGVLPLGLTPTLVAHLRSTVMAASSKARNQAIAEFLNAFEKSALMPDTKTAQWSDAHFEDLRRHTESSDMEDISALDADPSFISDRLRQIDDQKSSEALSLAARIDAASLERKSIEEQIAGFDGGSATALLEELKEAERKNGSLEVVLLQHEQVVSELRRKRDGLDTEWNRAQHAVLSQVRGDRSREFAASAREALVDYEEQLLDARVASLKDHFVGCFSRLIRKSGLVETISIDKETFDISLIGADGAEIPRDSLSAGERQIFAVAMLWALGKTSGRSLPMVIDTPFSRLDHRHRRSIIENYVTAASHQVILLCTDTEMTPDLEELISPYVTAVYQLDVADGARETSSLPLFALPVTELVDAH